MTMFGRRAIVHGSVAVMLLTWACPLLAQKPAARPVHRGRTNSADA